jgi:hypothetical protein
MQCLTMRQMSCNMIFSTSCATKTPKWRMITRLARVPISVEPFLLTQGSSAISSASGVRNLPVPLPPNPVNAELAMKLYHLLRGCTPIF